MTIQSNLGNDVIYLITNSVITKELAAFLLLNNAL